jgi:putative oxidoreductase
MLFAAEPIPTYSHRMSISSRTLDLGLAVIRIGTFALLLVYHGWQKLLSAYGYVLHGHEWKFITGVGNLGFPAPALFAVCSALAESIGSLFLIVGFFTRYAAAFVAFNMAVAVYRHLTSDWKFELAALYLLVALAFVFLPSGRYSVDARR